MPQDKNRLHSKHCHAIFQTRHDLRCHDIPCHPRHKDLPNTLIEDDLHRHARVGTRKNRSKRLLLAHRLLLQNLQIRSKRSNLPGSKSLVACHQLSPQRHRSSSWRCRSPSSTPRHPGGYTCHCRSCNKLPPRPLSIARSVHKPFLPERLYQPDQLRLRHGRTTSSAPRL